MTTYTNTRFTDDQVEEQGLGELRDVYINYVELYEDYLNIKQVRDTMDLGHPLFSDAAARTHRAKRALAGAAVLYDMMSGELVAKRLKASESVPQTD